jgi:hypothetical protein
VSRRDGLAILGLLAGLGAAAAAEPRPFVHPGMLHTRESLVGIRARLAAGGEPWTAGLAKLRADPHSRADWRIRGPFETVVRDPAGSRRIAEFDADANAAYQNALMGCLVGDRAHAAKAAAILDAWSGRLREITGRDRELGASLGGFKLLNAAELLRHTPSGWTPEGAARFGDMVRRVLVPVVRDFAPHANGNWGTGCIKTLMAAGVYCEDRALFDRAAGYFLRGAGNACLTNYVINAAGQCQESGRDQSHVQLGLGHLADACEIAWTQGLDLYGAFDNRLLAGFEYTAAYNLGEEVPFVRHVDTTGKYRWGDIAVAGRGELRPIYERVWSHYGLRRGLPAPHTRRAAEKLRPEGAWRGADHPGFGTLFQHPTANGQHPTSKTNAER